MRRRFARRRADQRGAIAVVAAIALPMLLAATALSLDIGREVDTNRHTQALADAVALDAAKFLDGTAASVSDPYVSIQGNTYNVDQVVQYEATQSAMRNGLDALAAPTPDSIVLGSCSGTPGSDNPCYTFTPVETCPLTSALPAPGQPDACTPISGADPATVLNAVKMSASGLTTFVFALGRATSDRDAVAMRLVPGQPPTTCCSGSTTTTTPPAPTNPLPVVGVSAFSIGSGLAAADTTNGSYNQVLDQVLGQELQPNAGANVDALSFSGLANASVSVNDILASNSSVGTLSDLLDTSVSPGTALAEYYNALIGQDSPASLTAAAELSSDLGVSPTGTSGIDAQNGVTLCELITLSGTSSCSASGTQLAPAAYAQFDALDFLVGVASLIDEHHAISVTLGSSAAQATVYAVSPVASAGPGPAAQPSCPTGFSPCPVTATDIQGQVEVDVADLVPGVSLQLQVTGAPSTGQLDDLVCSSSPSALSATIDGSAGTATVAPTFTTSTATVTGTTLSVGGTDFSLTFNGPFPTGPQTTSNTNTNIDLTAPSQLGALQAPVNTALASLNTELPPLLQALGVNLGYATVSDNHVDCTTTILVTPGQ